MNKRFIQTFSFFTFYLLACTEPVDWFERAKIEYQQADYLGAIVALNAHLVTGDSSCEALCLRASSYRRIEKWRLAALDLKRAEAKWPKCIEARLELARVLSDSGDTAGAHRQLIHLESTIGKLGAEIQIELALVAYKQDRFHHALNCLNRAIAYDSTSHLAWYYRGYLRSRFTDDDHSSGTRIMELLDFNQAIADFSHCLSIDPQFADAWYQRGIVHLNRFDRKKGLADVERAIQLEPEFSYYYTGRAEYYLREKEFNAAKKDLEKACAINPNDSLSKELLQQSIDSLKKK